MSTEVIMAELKKLGDKISATDAAIDELKKSKSSSGVSPATLLGGTPNVRTGESTLSSRGYSFLRAAAYARGHINADEAKVEIDVHNKLYKGYVEHTSFQKAERNSFLVPFSSAHIAQVGDEAIAREVGELTKAGVTGYDAEEVAYLKARHYGGLSPQMARQKALSWLDEGTGGALVAPPVMGELIELFRNNEALMQSGARDIGMPPSGRITFPRQTDATTFYWVGESTAITESTPATGDVVLTAKKAGILVTIPNELFRFASVSVEQFVRDDMAKVMALGVDKQLLEGVGSSIKPKGLITYSGISAYTASTTGASGDTFEPEDVQGMVAAVEEKNATFGAWIMRPGMYGKIRNRRADAVTAADKKGMFLFDVVRGGDDGFGYDRLSKGNLGGYPVTKSTQVGNDRVKVATNLTYVLGGDFSDYMLAMGGVVEFAVSPYGDTAFKQDQTVLRAIAYVDGAPRHEAAFVLCDTLVVA